MNSKGTCQSVKTEDSMEETNSALFDIIFISFQPII